MKITIHVRPVEGTDDVTLRFECPEIPVTRGDVARAAHVLDKMSLGILEAAFVAEAPERIEVEV